VGTGSFPGVESGLGVTLTPHPLLVARFKKQIKAIPLISLKAFLACKKFETYYYYSVHNLLGAYKNNVMDSCFFAEKYKKYLFRFYPLFSPPLTPKNLKN
jgi:hypothetical protein